MRFDLLFGVGDGVGEAFFRFGEAVGVGVGVVFFFRVFSMFATRRWIRLEGLLIFVPNDSSAGFAARSAPNTIATAKNHSTTDLNASSFYRAFP